jgi:iron(III) transport system substrate-binding protein
MEGRRLNSVHKVMLALLILTLILPQISLKVQATDQQLESELVLYTTGEDRVIKDLVSFFNAKYPDVKVSYVLGGTGTILGRIDAEKDNPLGDVVWEIQMSRFVGAKAYLQPYDSPMVEQAIPAEFRDPEKIFFPVSIWGTVIAYNTNLVKPEEAPTGWFDLLDEKWYGKVFVIDPPRTGSSYVQLYYIVNHPDLGWSYAEKLAVNAAWADAWAAVWQAVAAGEFPVVVITEPDVIRLKNTGSPVELVYIKEGAPFEPAAVAMIKGAKHPVAAGKLIDVALSKEWQEELLKIAWERPMRPDIDVSAFGMEPMSAIPQNPSINMFSLQSVQAAAAARTDLLAKWDEIKLRIPDMQKARDDARNALDQAQKAVSDAEQAGRTVGLDDAKSLLVQAQEAYAAYDFAKAKSFADQASEKVGTAKSWTEAYGTTVAAVAVLIVLIAALALIWRKRSAARRAR